MSRGSRAVPDLDDPDRIDAADPGDFLGAVEAFPAQVGEGWRLGLEARGLPVVEGLTGVAILGMGGSGISGDVCRAVLAPRSPLPVESVKGYRLPAWVGPGTLVVAASYSGNTEETLEAFEAALEAGAAGVAVCSGGRLSELAAGRGATVVAVPGGLQPRAALGYLAMPILALCARLGLAPGLPADVDEAVALLEGRAAASGRKVPVADNPAKQLALRLAGMVPLVYGSEGEAAVAAYRWKCQLNECAKVPAFWHSFSELDHNEIVGWGHLAEVTARFALVVLRHPGEHPRIARRVEATLDLVGGAAGTVEQVWGTGSSPLARLLDLAYAGDLAATYLGIARGVDPMPVEAIERLKRAL